MHNVMDFLLRHGYIVIFIAVFIEQIGLPIPSGPVLLAAGALAGFRRPLPGAGPRAGRGRFPDLRLPLVCPRPAARRLGAQVRLPGLHRTGYVRLQDAFRLLALWPGVAVHLQVSALVRYPRAAFGRDVQSRHRGGFSSSMQPPLCCGRERISELAGCSAGNSKTSSPHCPDSAPHRNTLSSQAW